MFLLTLFNRFKLKDNFFLYFFLEDAGGQKQTDDLNRGKWSVKANGMLIAEAHLPTLDLIGFNSLDKYGSGSLQSSVMFIFTCQLAKEQNRSTSLD